METTQDLSLVPPQEIRLQTSQALIKLSVRRALRSIFGRTEAPRAGDEVIVQGQDDRHALREATNEIAGERSVMVNMNDVYISHCEVHSPREARLRVLRRSALT
jgi:hypothetical protein